MVGTYILSVTAAAMLCSLVRRMTQSDWSRRILKAVSGLVMAAVILGPLAQGVNLDPRPVLGRLEDRVLQAVETGNLQRQEALASDIKQRTEAYILDKATELGYELQAEVRLSDSALPVPMAVTLTGNIPERDKTTLTVFLTKELGIREEEVIWRE